MSKSKIDFRRYTVAIVTMGIVAALLSFYFLFYVAENDSDIKKRNFRVLNRTINNIKTRAGDYQKLFKSKLSIDSDSAKNDALPSVIASRDSADKNLKRITRQIFEKADRFRLYYEKDSSEIKKLSELSLERDMDSSYLKINLPIDSGKVKIIQCGVSAVKFLTPILRDDVFQNYILVKGTNIFYKNFPQEFIIEKFDSLFETGSRFKTNSIITSKFAGRHFTLFVSPFEFSGENNFALVGIVATEKLNAEKYAVPGSFIIVVLSIIFFILLSMPLVKTVLMSENERLKTFDVLASFFCFMLGFGLLLFIFILNFAFAFKEKDQYDAQQRHLAASIEKSFRNDLLSAYYQLTVYDSLVTRYPCYIKNINSESLTQIDCKFNCLNPLTARSFLKPTINSSFKYVYWLDSEGDEIVRWTTDSRLPGRINYYKDRPYFQQIKNHVMWKLPDSTRAPFAMEPVFSWLDSRFRVVVAKETRDTIRVDSVPGNNRITFLSAISSPFQSVINTVLPAGYSYCIINNDGETWFHTDTRKNLNEKFTQECGNGAELMSLMYTQKPAFINTHYSGIDSRIYIAPIEGLPLYLVVMRNLELESAKHVQIFLITMGLSVTLMLAFIILLAILIVLRWRVSKLKQNFIQVRWLYPSEKNKGYYHMTIFLNVLTTVISFLITSPKHPLFTFYVFVVNIIISLSSFYYIGIKEELWYYKKQDKRNFYLLSVILMLLLVFSAIRYLENPFALYLYFYMVFCLVCAFVLFNTDAVLPARINAIVKKIISPVKNIDISYKKVYSIMIFWWLMHVIFVPVVRFFQIADSYESTNLLKYDQLHTVSTVSTLVNSADATIEKFKILNGPRDTVRNIYLYTGSTLVNDSNACSGEEESAERKKFGRIIKSFHVIYNKAEAEQEEIYSADSSDASLRWAVCDTSIYFKYSTKIKKTGTPDKLLLTSSLPEVINPLVPFTDDPFAVFGYILLLLLLIRLLYNCVNFFINKFFLINYFENSKLEHANPLFIDESDLTLKPNPPTKMILISLPNSGKRKHLAQIIKAKGKGSAEINIDFSLIDTSEWDTEKSKADGRRASETVVLHYFENKISEPLTNVKKLEFIESLFKKKLQNIIILTTVHPRAFLSMLKKDEAASDISDVAAENSYYRWAMLLSSFKIIYYPVVKNSAATDEINSIADLIRQECSYGEFLKKQQDNLIIYAESRKDQPADSLAEEIILMIQHQAEAYYLSVWHSLTRDEQYVLYDMAEDELSNYKNREALTMLFNKGLIVHEGRLKIMNLSFRNFILTIVKPESKVINDMERAKGSSFNKFKVPFFIILIATMFFIFYTQEDTFNKLIAIVASFTASLPLVLRLFSLIPGVKGSQS